MSADLDRRSVMMESMMHELADRRIQLERRRAFTPDLHVVQSREIESRKRWPAFGSCGRGDRFRTVA